MPGELNSSRRATTAEGQTLHRCVVCNRTEAQQSSNSTSASLKMGMSIVWTISEMVANLRPHERSAVLPPTKQEGARRNSRPSHPSLMTRALSRRWRSTMKTREPLMLAYMNEVSLKMTIEKGEAVYYSRSRQEIWHKGATSGHTQIDP